ncbi:uncharacterized protein LOC141670470 [Apium graveolens]|uniref:uncharacterized protein LOC141670470 n=1 Tax=Apium graveolens TaxID=4045 RepID=UPI003D7A68C9
MNKFLVVDEVDDASEVLRLREEAWLLRAEKLKLEKKYQKLTKDNNASADIIFSLLTEKSELMNECGSLNIKIGDLENEIRGLQAALSASKDEIVEKEGCWVADKAEPITKLDGMADQLAHHEAEAEAEAEALSSFEEGYNECVKRFAGIGMAIALNVTLPSCRTNLEPRKLFPPIKVTRLSLIWNGVCLDKLWYFNAFVFFVF